MKVPLITSGCTVPLDSFWTSALIFHDRPHIVNKKICGVKQLYLYEVTTELKDLSQYFTYSSVIYEIRKISVLSNDNLSHLIVDILRPYDKTLELTEIDRNLLNGTSSKLLISLRILLPKSSTSNKCIEIVILNKIDNRLSFYAVEENNKHMVAPRFPYHLECTSGHVRITVDNFEDADSASSEWLVDKVFSKIIKWSSADVFDNTLPQSLSLISLEKYVDLYQLLKEKYGKHMCKIWSENTDPQKFVYEDVAIATYLICLWENTTPNKKPTFLDLGCGNGLLVYILSQEGYEGYGIDVRERKIWKTYPETTKLMIKTIIPSASSLFPHTDWIIGNHSDELTPWIPVIAMRSSYKTNFFLLPCCSFDFSGKKYARVNTAKSQYLDYLDYVRDICKKCGFITKTDKLRIPSTKKTCIVSWGRTYEYEEHEVINQKLTEFISARNGSQCNDTSNWIEDFKPRANVEKVQNCTQLNRNLVERIVNQVVMKLLEENISLKGHDGKLWNRGGNIHLNEIISCIEKKDLKELKNNCGGLQTLLRNHRYIFEVKGGYVCIRVPQKLSNTTKYKNKLCWFWKNHVDGCLNSSESCAYKHE